MEKIDFVLPWVDGNNNKWREIRKIYMSKMKSEKDSQALARFRDMETLKYVLRAIEKNCPWYNKIYLITKGYYPAWLDINHPKIVLVEEETLFIDKTHLPVFSSVAIEMNLVNIRGLSEKFIYLNDDMIIMNPLRKERFFKENKPVDFFVHGWIPRNFIFEIFKKRDTWICSINNTFKLINSKNKDILIEDKYLYNNSYGSKNKLSNFLFKHIYKKIFWIEHWHHPQPLLKSTLEEVYQIFKIEMLQCSQNKFRDKSDLNQYMYRYWQLINGNFYPYKHNDALVLNLDSINKLESLIEIIQNSKRINFVCFNDSIKLEDEEYEKVKFKLLNYLDTIFQNKSSFEY